MTDDQKAEREAILAYRRKLYYISQGYILVKESRERWYVLKLSGYDSNLQNDGSVVGWLRAEVLYGPATGGECEARLMSVVVPIPDSALYGGSVQKDG